MLLVEEGSLYPSLHRMEEAGWIKARTITTDNNRTARAYEITATGRRQLGIAAGLAIALLLNHVLVSLLFGVTPTDPLTFAIAVPAIVTVAAAASWFPAWRASRLDPIAVLRAD